jgi:D-alanyl-lipoteichoic acid acyltransferase DltB (MBOAT superfamily)
VLFNTFSFPIFLAVAFVVYRLLQGLRLPRLLWLLLISAFFYGCWQPWYLILVAISTANSYCVGLALDRFQRASTRKALLIIGVTGDLALLGVFKYGNFFGESIEAAAAAVGFGLVVPRVPAALPVGISFYTFQTLSYTIDVYRRKIPATRSLLDFSVFVLFFPQLVAGPIVRGRDFLPQLIKRPRLDTKALGEGIALIGIGLTKKMILADLLSTTLVQPYFDHVWGRGAIESVLVLWAANFQVYCDFSGYSDVAIGAALLFGFALPQNFNRPFVSRSPMEHWRRWHISLSLWLRDYLYFPLGGSRQGKWRTTTALMVTFVLGGLWHGAGWTFLFWGFYNGVLLVVWREWAPKPATTLLGKAIEVFATFNAICFGLIFLHARTFAEAWEVCVSLVRFSGGTPMALPAVGLSVLVFTVLLHASPARWKIELQRGFSEAPSYAIAASIVVGGGVLSLFAGMARPFFYFQF